MTVPRRTLLTGAAGLAAVSVTRRLFGPLVPPAHARAPDEGLHPEFPSHHPIVVRNFVSAAHTDFELIREELAARPALAKVSWDWGFGDWESALDAAAHMGRGDIAQLLIDHGAQPTLFSAAALGQLDVIRAHVETTPGVQGTLGAHSLTLMHHARRGGEDAAAVVAYLEEVGGADEKPTRIKVEPSQLERYHGTYALPEGDPFILTKNKRGALRIQRGQRFGRTLFPVGEHTFHPSGGESVRVRFRMEGERAVALTVHDPDLMATATRVEP